MSESNGLKDMAGIMADAEVENIDQMRHAQPKTAGQYDRAIREKLIEECAPDNAFDEAGLNRAGITAFVYNNGIIAYSFNGVEFIQFDAPVIKATSKKGSFSIASEIKYRKIAS